MRETTERPEGIEAGTARLVGAIAAKIVEETFRLLDDDNHYRRCRARIIPSVTAAQVNEL